MRTSLLSTLGAVLLLSASASAVTMDWTPIGNPGNACDPQPEGCFGSVDYAYSIGTYEVTNAQYAEFLNAVAATDTNNLYNPDPRLIYGLNGITRSGSDGSYTYSTIDGRENMPANFVTAYDAMRFANWLQNGQPTGAQSSTTTEDGAYTFSGPVTVGARNAGATILLTSEDEWYKAAYYDALTTSYFAYATGSNVAPSCAPPGATPNTANCNQGGGDFTPVGSYTGSPSPYGTFDQAGNATEIAEGIQFVLRGPGFATPSEISGASFRQVIDPANYGNVPSFRVVMIPGGYVPEPGTGLLVIAGLLGLAGWRRSH